MRSYPGAATDANFPTIRITGGPKTEAEIERILLHIHVGSHSRAGALIIDGILRNGDRREGVTIHNPHHKLHNAITNPRGAHHRSDQPDSTALDLLRNPGRGAGSQIEYFPWEWHQIGGGRPGAARDEILLHELVHAYMIQRGASSVRNLHRARYARRVRRFDIVDDFFAIMITNVYSSECGRPIRREHHGFRPLDRNAMSIISDPQFRQFFTALAGAAPDLVTGLRAIDTEFNPWNPRMDLIDAISVFDDP
jgi:hypothetical protein